MGLSPRVRGNLWAATGLNAAQGSIPACAGEPPFGGAEVVNDRVYPRVCGGTLIVVGMLTIVAGLSPRVRGNPSLAVRIAGLDGSIPACAGEPLTPVPVVSEAKVYPRVCGGTYIAGPCAILFAGLSPRVRGNHSAHSARPAASGSIPACAGEPLGVLIVTPATVFAKGIMLRRWQHLTRSRPAPSRGGRCLSNSCRLPVAPEAIPACAGEPSGVGSILTHLRRRRP